MPDEFDRAAAKARCEAATEGPWLVDEDRWSPPQWPEGTAYFRVVHGDPNPLSGIRQPVVSTNGAPHASERDVQNLQDAEFIAHARTDLPAALAALEAAEAQRDRIKNAAQGVLSWHRVECGCNGATCGYGERLVGLRAALTGGTGA